MNLKRRVWVEIDLGKVRSNFSKVASAVAPAGVLAVMKANAYGLGVAEYAKALDGAEAFGVAEPYEAAQLAPVAGKPVQILSAILPDEIADMVELGVTLPVASVESARLISAAAAHQNRAAKVHFKIDTGMGRLGILERDAVAAILEVRKLPNLDFEGIFTHCPMAYDPADPYTADQIERFAALVDRLSGMGIDFKYRHIAASDAINNFPRSFKAPFNLVRTGINLHGSFDPNGRRSLELESVLTLKTRVAQVRRLPAGTTLGYGRTWCLNRDTDVATISAGYADGLPLALGNRAQVLVRGVRCPVIGRISMDYTTVDVSHVPGGVGAGDEVVCLGEGVTPDHWGALKGTHAYDIICSLGNRVERVFVQPCQK